MIKLNQLSEEMQNPVTPVFMKEGRVLIEIMVIKAKTKAGIELPPPKAGVLRTGRILAFDGVHPEEIKDQVKKGDLILFNYLNGATVTLEHHNPTGRVLCFLHAYDVYARWNVHPNNYNEAVVDVDFEATGNEDFQEDFIERMKNHFQEEAEHTDRPETVQRDEEEKGLRSEDN